MEFYSWLLVYCSQPSHQNYLLGRLQKLGRWNMRIKHAISLQSTAKPASGWYWTIRWIQALAVASSTQSNLHLTRRPVLFLGTGGIITWPLLWLSSGAKKDGWIFLPHLVNFFRKPINEQNSSFKTGQLCNLSFYRVFMFLEVHFLVFLCSCLLTRC